jgi:hypothetical protein
VALISDNEQLLTPASHPHIDCVKTEEFAVGRILITPSKMITQLRIDSLLLCRWP